MWKKQNAYPPLQKEEEAEAILTLMQQSFEPYTSALPDLDPCGRISAKIVCLRQGREKLLGFLRFGREKKVSVLWQIAVAPDGRGKGHWQRSGAGLACHRER